MFQTYPASQALTFVFEPDDGGRNWHWVELALHIPIIYLRMDFEDEGIRIGREFLFTRMRDVLKFIDDLKIDGNSGLVIGLLSTGHMNGSDFYEMARVSEVWADREGNYLYVLTDGRRMRSPSSCEETEDMQLILGLSPFFIRKPQENPHQNR